MPSLHDVAVGTTRGQALTALYLGDFDPSGMNMSEVDLPKRLPEYLDRWGVPGSVTIERVALTEADAADRTLLPFDLGFPADTKGDDTRHRWFVERYGDRCWELDAMSRQRSRRGSTRGSGGAPSRRRLWSWRRSRGSLGPGRRRQ